ncbi:MAG: EamA family transporter [Bacteroidia bacterium]|nr:EamA family transporter [Bacteroidia bacterium]
MNTKLLNWIILILLALIWGSSFILMKRGLETFSSDEVAALRIFIAFLFLSPLLIRHFKKDLIKHWKGFLGMGMLGNFIPAFLFTKAETGISSSLTGMLNSLTPLFTLLLGVLMFRSKTKMINAIGILIGFVGAIGLLTAGKSEDMNNNLLFGIYVVLATICYALSVNIIKKELGEVNSITATVWAMLFIGPLAGIYLFGFTDFLSDLKTNALAYESLGYVSILAIFGTAISVIIFNVLIKNTNALFASSVTYLIPVVAMGWGILDGENVVFLHFIWIVVILLGVYLVNKKPKV